MRIQKIISFLFLAVCLSSACAPRQKQTENQTIYVSILPLRELVQGIVGDDFPVEVLVPPGASPETFEPTARQYIGLNRSLMIFNVGLIDFETTLLSKIEDQEKVVNLSHGIELIAGSCSHCSHGHVHAHGVDPHVWTSPKALQRMAKNTYEAIHRICPDSAKYTENHLRLQERLADLDRRTGERIAASGVSYFLIYHPALTYYARNYRLQQVAIEEDGKEPSAQRIARLIAQARCDSVRRLFYQSQFPASSVEVIASDIGAEAVRIDPLREDIIAWIDEVTSLITER